MFEARFKAVRSHTAALAANTLDAAIAEAATLAQEKSCAAEQYVVAAIVNSQTGAVTELAGEPLPPDGEVDVLWTVRLTATSGEEAASLARLMQFDPTSIASVYRTRDSGGRCEVIDLQDVAGPRH